MNDPLGKTFEIQKRESTIYQYFVSVIPVIYTNVFGSRTVSYQYSAKKFASNADPRRQPGLYLM
jgi:hypothetical protein